MLNFNIDNLFANYETTKLIVSNPNLTNAAILLVLLVMVLLTSRKSQNNFMDHVQTSQIKGLAILLVIVGHLWSHVASQQPGLMLSGCAVSLFLLTSGYGLTCSWDRKPLSAKDYIVKRISKVMIPYWIITILILVLDYRLLERSYSVRELVLTFAGENSDETLRHLDYARWYITLLLLFYIVFYIANRCFSKRGSIIAIFLFAFIITFIGMTTRLYIGSFHHHLAFPLGCLIASNYKYASEKLSAKSILLPIIACCALVLISLQFLFPGDAPATSLYAKLVIYGTYQLDNISWYILIFMTFCLTRKKGFVSKGLVFCGGISYEMYLIHGPLLIKYNPIFKLFPNSMITLSFIFYLVITITISYCLNRSFFAITSNVRKYLCNENVQITVNE